MKAETSNGPKHQAQMTIECLVLNGTPYHPLPGSCNVLGAEAEIEELENWGKSWKVQSSRYDSTITLMHPHACIVPEVSCTRPRQD